MRRRRAVIALPFVLVALALAACGGGDDDDATPTTPAPSVEAPRSTPPNNLGSLPSGFVECMADKGYEIASPDDIHAAPPDVLQACFGSSH